MKKILKQIRPTAYILFLLTGFLFLFCCLTGHELAESGNIVWTASYTIRTLSISLFVGGLLGGAFCIFFTWLDLRPESKANITTSKTAPIKSWKIFAGSLFLIVLAWLPAYLAYYPAICAYDMPVQIGQFKEGLFNDHHPLFHTLLIEGFMNLGEKVFGSTNTGIGLMAFMQILLLAAAFAYGIAFLYRMRVKKICLILTQVYCMFYPFHWYMSVSITKDTVFTAFFVFLMIELCKLISQPDKNENHLKNELAFFLAAIGTILFRNNGTYAFLVLLTVLFFVFLFGKTKPGKTKRRFWGRILLWSFAALVTGNLLLSAIFRISGAEQGDKREMLSMPIQQLARTMIYHGGVGVLPEDDNTMEETDKALINDFILDRGYVSYSPDISDPVKSHTNTYVVRFRAKDFLTTYLKLFAAYPGDYINAALAVNAGYLYPNDVSHALINVTEGQTGKGYIQTYWREDILNQSGIHKASKWEWLHDKLQTWADENAYLELPVLKYLFVPGVWLWFYLLILAHLVMKKQYRQCIPLSLIGGYFITLFLGPTVQLRYIYPVMAAFPFTTIHAVCTRKFFPPHTTED